MDAETMLILGVIVIGVIVLFFALRGRGEKDADQGALLLQNQIQELHRILDTKLSEAAKAFESQFDRNARIIRDVTEKLTRVDETNRQSLDFNKSFAEQLRNLEQILQNPKQRGILGEYYLETLLKNAFHPKQYQMQYKFKNGDVVDAALFFGDKIIPIDSKFSLENYNRIIETKNPAERERLEKVFKQDLKNRIDETAKYIRPEEGTLEFAFMFIPAEGIYYDLLVNQVGAVKVNTRDLIDYAINEKKVHIVSPTTFYVTLQSLFQGMRAFAIQESTKDILKNVAVLSRHLKAYSDYFRKVGGHLSTTVNAYVVANREFAKIEKDVVKLGGEAIGVEAAAIAKPDIEE